MTVLKQAQPAAYSRILGIGGERGELVVTNDDIAGPIDSSDEWIRQRTGIITRRRAGADRDVLDLAEVASAKAIAAAGIAPEEIDAVVMSTISHFVQTPSAAAILADRIGANPAAAYDISAACAGYCYAIGQADALVRSGNARNVLVVGAEKLSEIIDPTDRSISFLLGDGAGAAVVGTSDTPGIGPTVWGSDGSKASSIRQTHSWTDLRADPSLGWPTLRQDGQTVFKWAGFQVAKFAQAAMDAAGVGPEDIDVFVPHQANMRIIDQLLKQLKLPDSVVVGRDIADTGNTSAASVPLAIERLQAEGQVKPGDVCLQLGFGAGLVYAAQVVVLP
ncbi:3-oxoacyl-(acyl-carrier-protein) synthase III [Xylanimonas cellulosilytica DSM 15894]|uniref:Beta-ketoacyl-[acyl-carrier-protein] synthase III n=1 Tax=Xylanimonas cellulosilytica (strain DSM 15894 / JCM 12276 / CECT 5975 / KCTC 9989 / LMG 20990 / NBRC 107835 / XIL07) TaxID=446471 RepID=D1BUE1_XYLCX|nr:beta-ketoacyl-ACP synthase III [Xylanimonas cellulosilytica]ACZ31154.1 3-oxoacyl-(acyl-carrier-protein) synthase III [Xylanimonas cellulosilytica DSM 15894]